MTGPEPQGPRPRRQGRAVRPPPQRPPPEPSAPAPEPQLGVPPEQVATGQASPEPRCPHSWEVTASQKWLWRVSVRCRRCDYSLPLPGTYWRERDVRQVVELVLDRMAAEGAEWERWAAEHGAERPESR